MRLACLFDCDNTLIDNDAIKADYDRQLRALLGEAGAAEFWRVYEDVRQAAQVVDYPETVKRLRPALGDTLADRIWSMIWDYPFAERIFPGALAAIDHMRDLSCAVGILSDGDPIYQPHKIATSGLADAVGGEVRVYVHKQQHLNELAVWMPADRSIIVDDKAVILADIKRADASHFITVHVRQGHYANEIGDPAPDLSLASIGELAGVMMQTLVSL
jgi:FMN phosphatase YigB (HAD superfamily)